MKEVKMNFYQMESIKMIVGMPSQATTRQVEARLSELVAKEEELEALKGERVKRTESAKS
jgi:hypothetical protein